jgi:hypothetical protein
MRPARERSRARDSGAPWRRVARIAGDARDLTHAAGASHHLAAPAGSSRSTPRDLRGPVALRPHRGASHGGSPLRAPVRPRRVRSLIVAVAVAVAAPALVATASAEAPVGDAPAAPAPALADRSTPLAAPAPEPAPAPATEPTPPPEAYPAREPQTSCDVVDHHGVEVLRDVILAGYPDTGDGGIVRDCGAGGSSEHKEGRAWDWMLDANDPADAAAADDVLSWLLATDEAGEPHALARRLGLLYVIWDGEIWSASRAGEGWRPYDGASPHTDHVHLSFSTAGAGGETSFFETDVWDPRVGEPYPATVPAATPLA